MVLALGEELFVPFESQRGDEKGYEAERISVGGANRITSNRDGETSRGGKPVSWALRWGE